jgi:hypothetical protein
LPVGSYRIQCVRLLGTPGNTDLIARIRLRNTTTAAVVYGPTTRGGSYKVAPLGATNYCTLTCDLTVATVGGETFGHSKGNHRFLCVDIFNLRIFHFLIFGKDVFHFQ